MAPNIIFYQNSHVHHHLRLPMPTIFEPFVGIFSNFQTFSYIKKPFYFLSIVVCQISHSSFILLKKIRINFIRQYRIYLDNYGTFQCNCHGTYLKTIYLNLILTCTCNISKHNQRTIGPENAHLKPDLGVLSHNEMTLTLNTHTPLLTL